MAPVYMHSGAISDSGVPGNGKGEDEEKEIQRDTERGRERQREAERGRERQR